MEEEKEKSKHEEIDNEKRIVKRIESNEEKEKKRKKHTEDEKET